MLKNKKKSNNIYNYKIICFIYFFSKNVSNKNEKSQKNKMKYKHIKSFQFFKRPNIFQHLQYTHHHRIKRTYS